MTHETNHSAAQPGPGDHVLTLCQLLANRIGKAFVTVLETHNVSVAEWRVVLTLAQHEKACGQEITGRWAMDKMAVNRAIAGLKRRGLIETRKNRDDRRVVDLMLTARGRTLYEKLLPVANQRYHRLMAGLEKSEAKLLRRIMLKMIAHADTITD